MSKFGGFFARKAGLFDNPTEPTPASAANVTALPDNPLEIDEELFSALGAQIGGDNESLRNLMLDANAKIGELDTIKAAVGKLVDPLSKTLTEKLLVEAREHLLGRAEQIRDYDRRTGEIAMERDALQARVSDLEAERINRESELKEVDHARATLIERSASLARAFAAKEAALARAEDTIAALTERLGVLETALAADKQATEQQIEDLTAAVRREKLERAVVEGALETGRKDFARLMRDVMALQRSQQAAEDPMRQRAANAA